MRKYPEFRSEQRPIGHRRTQKRAEDANADESLVCKAAIFASFTQTAPRAVYFTILGPGRRIERNAIT